MARRLYRALVCTLFIGAAIPGLAQTQAYERRVLATYFGADGSVYVELEPVMGDVFKCAPTPMYWFNLSDPGGQLIASNLIVAITNGRKVTVDGTGLCSPASSEFGGGYERLKRLSLFRGS